MTKLESLAEKTALEKRIAELEAELHRFMPGAPSVPIPPIDSTIAEERAGRECYGYTKEDDGIGKWLSAALDDPRACDEFKADIRAWFDSKERAESAKPECQPDGDKCIGCTTPPSGMTCALHGTVASVAERAKPEDDARDLALDLASDIWEPNTLYVGARNQWLVSASLKIEAFAAERERKLAERCADAAERWFYNTIASLESIELEGFLKPLREKQIATLRAAIMEEPK